MSKTTEVGLGNSLICIEDNYNFKTIRLEMNQILRMSQTQQTLAMDRKTIMINLLMPLAYKSSTFKIGKNKFLRKKESTKI